LSKTGGICQSIGGKNNFRETEGKCTETAKTGRKFRTFFDNRGEI